MSCGCYFFVGSKRTSLGRLLPNGEVGDKDALIVISGLGCIVIVSKDRCYRWKEILMEIGVLNVPGSAYGSTHEFVLLRHEIGRSTHLRTT